MSDRTRDPDAEVLVVGAGPTGLTAALVLQSRGVQVRVVDRASGPVAESRALVVQARTLELWHRLGLAERAVLGGQRVGAGRVMLDGRWLGGRRPLLDLSTPGRGKTAYPFVLVLEQSRTERLLLDALSERGVQVERSTSMTGLSIGEASVDVDLESPQGPSTVRAAYVIGSDGAHSTVRACAGIDFTGSTYKGAWFLADVAVDGPLHRDSLTTALDRQGRTVLFVPMRSRADQPADGASHRFRVFGELDPSRAADRQVTLEEAQAQAAEVSGLPLRLHDPRWMSVYRLSHRSASRLRAGRVFIAGDAAHVHQPLGGQGMNTGIQDAYNLSWKLAAVLQHEASERLLETYEAERQPIAEALVAGTDRLFRMISAAGPRAGVVRSTVSAVLPLVLRVPAAQRAVFGRISQISIAYRSSPAVHGTRSRRAAAGDRTPYHPVLHELLVGSEHHLLVLGDAAATTGSWLGELQTAIDSAAAPVHLHVLEAGDRGLRRALAARGPAAILVRPDGYVGWRGTVGDGAAFREHLQRWYSPANPPAGVTAPPRLTSA